MKASIPINQAKEQFINDWGSLALNWGIPRQTGRAHGFLLTRSKPVTYEELRAELDMSQGASNTAVRDLIQIGLVYQVSVNGERGFYFVAEKDMWKVAQAIAKERQRRELDPLTRTLSNYRDISGPKADVTEFKNLIDSISSVANIASKSISLLERSGVTSFLKLL